MLKLNCTAFYMFCTERMIYSLNIKVKWKPRLVHFLWDAGNRPASRAVNYSGKDWDLFSSAV